MRERRHFFTTLYFLCVLAVSTALFSGCQNTLDSGSMGAGAGQVVFSFNIQREKQSYSAEKNGARTVLPDDTILVNNLTLVLKAENVETSSAKWFLFPGSSGALQVDGSYKYSVILSAHNYFFTLFAYNPAEIAANASEFADDLNGDGNLGYEYYKKSDIGGGSTLTTMLWSHVSADLRNGGRNIAFTLNSTGLNGDSTIIIGGSFTDSQDLVSYYTIGLYDWFSNEIVNDSSDVSTLKIYSPDTSETAGSEENFPYSDPNKYSYDPSTRTATNAYQVSVPAGTYREIVKMYNASGLEIGTWSDSVIAEPKNISGEYLISIKNINLPPDSPSDFAAYLVPGSYGDSGYYDARFVWKDNSTNETNFLIRLDKYKRESASTRAASEEGFPLILGTADFDADGDGVYEVADGDTKSLYGSEFFAPDAINSTLYAGSESVVLRLECGYIYEAQIMAINPVGKSAWVNRGAASSDTDDIITNMGFTVGSAKNEYRAYDQNVANELKGLNLMFVRYYLNNGKYYKNEYNTLAGPLFDFFRFGMDSPALRTKSSTPDDVLDEYGFHPIIGDTWDQIRTNGLNKYPFIIRLTGSGGAAVVSDFAAWVYSKDGTAVDVADFAEQNVYLTAQYAGGADELDTIAGERITAVYGGDLATVQAGSGTTIKPADVSNPATWVTVVASGATQYIYLSLDTSNAAGSVSDTRSYSATKFYVNGNEQLTTGNTLVFSTDALSSGDQSIRIAGYCDSAWYEYAFKFRVAK